MSDLLTRFVVALEKIADGLTGAKVAVAQPSKDDSKPGNTTSNKPAATATNKDKPAESNKGAAATSGGKDAAKGAPAGTTKAPGGKKTLDQVREMIRKVATTDGLGKQSAVDILDEEGGVKSVAELKPENYDKVFEACEVAIAGAGKPAGDDMGDIM